MARRKSKNLDLPPISPAAQGPLYQQIVDGIKRAVAEGRIGSWDALPSFRALAEDLLVSLVTVKRAYEDLERQGIVVRKQGLGTFVAEDGPARSIQAMRDRAKEHLEQALREGLEAGLEGEELVEMIRELAAEAKYGITKKRHRYG